MTSIPGRSTRSRVGAILIAGGLALICSRSPPATAASNDAGAVSATAMPGYGGGGGITRDEYIEKARQRAVARGRDPDRAARWAARRFDQMDTNHDGVLDRAERAAWRQSHPGHRHGGGTQYGGQGNGGQGYGGQGYGGGPAEPGAYQQQ
jgi:hypothetical protein